MANPNGWWEATDAILDPRLPRRRLSYVALNGGFCLVFYEHGGFVKTDNIAAFRFSTDHAEPIWHVCVDVYVANPSTLSKAIQEKSYEESPSF
jgi:hypothetical protein